MRIGYLRDGPFPVTFTHSIRLSRMGILSTKEFHLAGSFLQWPPPFGTSPYEVGPMCVLLKKILCDFFMNSSQCSI